MSGSADERGRPDLLAVLVLLGGVLAVSTAATLIRLAEAEPLAIAAYRMIFATAILAPLAARGLRRDMAVLRAPDRSRLVAAGVFLAAHFALWIASLDKTTVASSVLLVTTSPLWVALAAPLVLGEPLPRRVAAGVGIAFVGAAVIGGGDLSLGAGHVVGDVLALGGAVAAAAYFLIGRQARARVRLISYVTLVYGVAAAVLTIVAVLSGTEMTGFAPRTWMVLVLLGAVPQVLGHSSFNWALGRLKATYVAGTVLGEAVGSTALAWIVLDEQPPEGALAGGALVLLGLALFMGSEEGR